MRNSSGVAWAADSGAARRCGSYEARIASCELNPKTREVVQHDDSMLLVEPMKSHGRSVVSQNRMHECSPTRGPLSRAAEEIFNRTCHNL
eukprot:6173053-Pleurochrysis_carterae.AAC.4